MLANINYFYKNKDTRKFIFTCLWIFTFLPNFKLFEMSKSIPLSFFYLISMLFLPMLLNNIKEIKIPPWYITGIYTYMIFYSFMIINKYGFPRGITHWIYGAYLLLIILTCANDFNENDWLDIAQKAILIFFAISIVYTVAFQWDYLLEITFGGKTPYDLRSITRGGRNLDATWLALYCFLLKNKKLRVFCITYATIYSIVAQSRVGILASFAVAIWTAFYLKKWNFKSIKVYAILLLVTVIYGMMTFYIVDTRINDQAPVFEANQIIANNESSSIENSVILSGRGAMWSKADDMFFDNPWGYGAANAVFEMKKNYGFNSYLALSIVQFHGGEALMIFVLGIYLQQNKKEFNLFSLERKEVL